MTLERRIDALENTVNKQSQKLVDLESFFDVVIPVLDKHNNEQDKLIQDAITGHKAIGEALQLMGKMASEMKDYATTIRKTRENFKGLFKGK